MREQLYFEIDELECRSEGDSGRKIGGYAALFNKLSEDLGGFREQIAPGAFGKSLKGREVVALWSHNPDLVLGRTSNETLVLEENARGLKFSLSLSDTSWGRDAWASIQRRDVKGMSFGFIVEKDSWDVDHKEEAAIRTLHQVSLFEVSATAFPAYPQTSVDTRSAKDILEVGLAEIAKREGSKFAFAREKAKLKLLQLRRVA
ncbi:conserved hypothetical protein [Gammaproteobacteria bacterium]